MNAPELIDALQRAGATLVVESGKARVRGKRVPDDLLAAVKGQRVEVLAEWQRRQDQSLDRYGIVPVGPVPMAGREIGMPLAERDAILAYVHQQPRPLHAWVSMRANEYSMLGCAPDDCEWRSCVDVVAWQRGCSSSEMVNFVKSLSGNKTLG